MALNLRQTVTDFLKTHPEERFTARDLACWMFENMREACEEKRRNSQQDLSDDARLLWQLVAEIGANRPEIQKRWPQVRTTETRPRRYYWTNASEAAEVAKVEGVAPELVGKLAGKALSEHALYPLLCRFLHVEQGLYPKRVDEKRSINRHGPNGNKWLYPDLVAMEDIGAEWDREIRACVQQVGAQRTRLWSFEVKLLVNRSNVREVWFQAVSNSSWANFGYLVAADIQESAMKELRLLAASYGIGLIRLNAEDPSESEILIPARERPDIDWDACNRLALENTDFRDFISWVRQFHQTDNARVGDWDLPEAVE
ncbi:COG2958 family protein [Dechloromonas denitrificans]|uniref:COG2958 family protein n=1 Tax=Dechloromonas denitrificans TaxID=281362 RepID=UPI001CF9B17A|nr:HrgA protein [Dechloromonas denitrificans]UCV06850.1 HrgA protein [Dechloromonas denitrificans]